MLIPGSHCSGVMAKGRYQCQCLVTMERGAFPRAAGESVAEPGAARFLSPPSAPAQHLPPHFLPLPIISPQLCGSR